MNQFLWQTIKKCIEQRDNMTVEDQICWCEDCPLYLDCAQLEEIGEIQFCPECKTELCHIMVGTEDVFGCPKCKKEISRDISTKI